MALVYLTPNMFNVEVSGEFETYYGDINTILAANGLTLNVGDSLLLGPFESKKWSKCALMKRTDTSNADFVNMFGMLDNSWAGKMYLAFSNLQSGRAIDSTASSNRGVVAAITFPYVGAYYTPATSIPATTFNLSFSLFGELV